MKNKDLEKYSMWLRINKEIAGPYHYISSSYIILFIIATILYLVTPEAFEPYKIYYLIGFFFLFFFSMIFFWGLLLKEIK